VTEFLREKHPKNSYDIRMSSSSTLIVLEATLADVPALQSIFARAFYPVSPYMKKAIPDTPQVAEWWGTVHKIAIKDPGIRLLKVVDSALDDEIIALCRWRVPGMFGKDAGLWLEVPLTSDHDEELCLAFIKPMGEQRKELMGDRPHYCKLDHCTLSAN